MQVGTYLTKAEAHKRLVDVVFKQAVIHFVRLYYVRCRDAVYEIELHILWLPKVHARLISFNENCILSLDNCFVPPRVCWPQFAECETLYRNPVH